MDVKRGIETYAPFTARPALLWLFSRYSRESKWHFVAQCTFHQYGPLSYQMHRAWAPTREGWLIYNHREELE